MGSRTGLAAALVTILVWSSSYPVARVGIRHFDPLVFSALRIVVAAGFLALIASPLRVGLPARGDRWHVFSSGIVGVTVYLALLNSGLEVVESAAAAVLLALAPIFVALMSMGFIGERLTLWGWIGLGGAFLGWSWSRWARGAGFASEYRDCS